MLFQCLRSWCSPRPPLVVFVMVFLCLCLPVHHILSFHLPRLQVPEVISNIRQVSKTTLKEDAKPKQETDEAFYNSQKFEVLYCGKVGIGAYAFRMECF